MPPARRSRKNAASRASPNAPAVGLSLETATSHHWGDNDTRRFLQNGNGALSASLALALKPVDAPFKAWGSGPWLSPEGLDLDGDGAKDPPNYLILKGGNQNFTFCSMNYRNADKLGVEIVSVHVRFLQNGNL